MRTWQLPLILTCATLLATWSLVGYTERNPPQSLARPLDQIPREIGGWVGADDPPFATRILRSLDATSLLSRTYRKEGRELNLFVSYYAKQKAGESMHSPKYCLPGGGWEPLETSFVTVPTSHGNASINKYVLQMGGARTLILYWYQSPGRVIASEYEGKALLFWDGLTHGRSGGSIVRLTFAQDTPEALNDGLELAPVVIAEMRQCLGG
jgi:EpsI family protein